MATRKALFTDLDDTLYSWIDTFAPSFRAMVHVLKVITSLDEEIIIESFRNVYKNRRTPDYSFVLQELDIWEKLGWSKDKVLEDAVKPARGAVSRVRSYHFNLFPEVRETLKWLKSESIFICACTNAPGYIAQSRLKKLKIDNFIDCLAYYYDYEIPVDVPEDVREISNYSKSTTFSSVKQIERFASLKKPNPALLLALIEKYSINPSKAYLIGDSIENDIYMAQQAGIIDIWARYGKVNHKLEDLETIRKITTYSDDEMQRNKIIRESVKPTFVVDNFAELKQIIGSNQLSLGF